MRKQLIENAAYEVATQVRAVEDAIEAALGEIAELQGRMIRARATTGVATATGHEAFEHLAQAVQGLVTARGGTPEQTSYSRTHEKRPHRTAFPSAGNRRTPSRSPDQQENLRCIGFTMTYEKPARRSGLQLSVSTPPGGGSPPLYEPVTRGDTERRIDEGVSC